MKMTNAVSFTKLAFENRAFKPSEESVEDYLTELQRLALLAYPGGPNKDHRDKRVQRNLCEIYAS